MLGAATEKACLSRFSTICETISDTCGSSETDVTGLFMSGCSIMVAYLFVKKNRFYRITLRQ